jgi:hypothetical protein
MRWLVVGSCSVLVVACQQPIPTVTLDSGPPVDAFAPDTGRDAPVGNDANADVGDASDAGFSPMSCRFDATMDLLAIDTDPRARPVRVATAPGPSSFGVVYSKIGTDGFENVYFSEIATMVGSPMAQTQLTTDLFTTTAPAITRTTTGWLASWLSNRDGDVEVYALGSGMDGRFTTPQRLTHTLLADEQSPVLASSGAASLIAWTEPGAMNTTTVVTQPIGADGTLTGTASRISPAGFTMRSQTLVTTDFGYAALWNDPTGAATILALDTMGAASGMPALLSPTDLMAGGAIDAAISRGGGGVVFDTTNGPSRGEVHAHLVDGAGGAIGVEQVLTVGADTGTSGSIAELGGGYVVAYRQAGAMPILRVLFLSSLLAEVHRIDVTSVSMTGGPTTIRVAGDGTVLITWADVVGTTTRLRGARIRCN